VLGLEGALNSAQLRFSGQPIIQDNLQDSFPKLAQMSYFLLECPE
jgi:hypothetical protein